MNVKFRDKICTYLLSVVRGTHGTRNKNYTLFLKVCAPGYRTCVTQLASHHPQPPQHIGRIRSGSSTFSSSTSQHGRTTSGTSSSTSILPHTPRCFVPISFPVFPFVDPRLLVVLHKSAFLHHRPQTTTVHERFRVRVWVQGKPSFGRGPSHVPLNGLYRGRTGRHHLRR